MIHRLGWTAARIALACAMLLIPWVPAHAGGKGGPIPIDQSAAIRGGVTPGDAPGFPVSIGTGGSYRLAGNLTVPNENTTAISITASAVSLDMAGFAIIGPTECTGNPLSCDPAGSGDGVSGTGLDISVRNGTVMGMGDDGVSLSSTARVEGVRASENGGTGIIVGGGGLVTGSIARANGEGGITAGAGSQVIVNTARENGGFGLSLSATAAYADNVITGNDSGQVSGGTEIGVNVCGLNTVCP